MLSEDLLKKVRQIEITTRKVVDDLMSGQYKSHFKGHGVQFSEHRQYVPGDDVRHIDWKVSARSREPLIKKYDEERELTVFLVVDVSKSKDFGSHENLKSDAAAELGGLLAFAAVHSGDKVGALLFAGESEKIIPPKKGKQHVLRIVRDVMGYEAKTLGTNLRGALQSAGRIMKHSGVVFVVSDFMGENYELELKRLARKHEVVAIQVSDRRETEMPKHGLFLFVDPETGTERWVDVGSRNFKSWFETYSQNHQKQILEIFKRSGVESIRVHTHEDYADAVVKFFQMRARRR